MKITELRERILLGKIYGKEEVLAYIDELELEQTKIQAERVYHKAVILELRQLITALKKQINKLTNKQIRSVS